MHAATNTARDIRSGLLAAKSSLAKLKDCLILNHAPWRPVYPGTILGDAIPAQPILPPMFTGPVENFCALETLPADLHKATIEGLFNRMANEVPAFNGLTWASLGDTGVTIQI